MKAKAKSETPTTKAPTAGDPRVRFATARLEELELQAAKEVAARVELDRQKQEHDAARKVAQAELDDAEKWREAEALAKAFPVAAAELQALGDVVRAAFDTIAEKMPALVAAQSKIDTMRKRATALAPRVRTLPHVRNFGGLDPTILRLLDHAVRCQLEKLP